MKTIITLLMTLFFSIPIVAQNGINYKALIKDNLGNVVANQSVTMQFSILKGTAQTNVYTETHTISTDANGIAIVNIGEGTPVSGDYNTIVWSSDEHHLNVQVDIGSGLVDMGTSEFKAVPYALNVTGLEALDEGNGVGWRLKGKNPNYFGSIGSDALDLSHNNDFSNFNGAVGENSFTTGFSTTASGLYSTAMGAYSIASGNGSSALGWGSSASGLYSSAIGRLTFAPSYAEIAIGLNNTSYIPNNTISWDGNDRLLVVGNGTNVSLSDALIILKNGTITAPSFDISEITDNKALITKEYLDANGPSGLETLDEGNGIGWRLKGINPANYGNIGNQAVDLSYNNTNNSTKGATGFIALATGIGTEASGDYSTAFGDYTEASGQASTALGSQTEASGSVSTATGFATMASGTYSSAFGQQTIASGHASVAFGKYNIDNSNALFSIGNGVGVLNRSNALTVLNAGRVGIGISSPIDDLHINTPTGNNTYIRMTNDNSGTTSTDGLLLGYANNGTSYLWSYENNNMQIGTNNVSRMTILNDGNVGIGATNPQVKLQVTGGTDAQYNVNTSGFMVIGNTISTNIVMDDNEIMARNNGGTSTLFLQQEGGNVAVNGSVVHTSDRRLKKDITELPYGLKDVLKLNPVSYNWKHKPNQNHKSLGLIAQELQKVINEVVTQENNKEKTLYVNYTELIPVLINAIKEQHKVIEKQKIENSLQGNQIKQIMARLNTLEGKIIN